MRERTREKKATVRFFMYEYEKFDKLCQEYGMEHADFMRLALTYYKPTSADILAKQKEDTKQRIERWNIKNPIVIDN